MILLRCFSKCTGKQKHTELLNFTPGHSCFIVFLQRRTTLLLHFEQQPEQLARLCISALRLLVKATSMPSLFFSRCDLSYGVANGILKVVFVVLWCLTVGILTRYL